MRTRGKLPNSEPQHAIKNCTVEAAGDVVSKKDDYLGTGRQNNITTNVQITIRVDSMSETY